MLVQDVAQNKSVRTAPWDSLELPLPLTVRNSSQIFRGMPSELREQIAQTNVTMHNHGAGAQTPPPPPPPHPRLLAPLSAENRTFTKTGSGQT